MEQGGEIVRSRQRIDGRRTSAIQRNRCLHRQSSKTLERIEGVGRAKKIATGRSGRSLSGTLHLNFISTWAKLTEIFFTTSHISQFYADANETESWLREKMPLVRSTDCGEDGPGAQALLARHRDLEGQIRAYEGDIQSLNSQADRLVASGVTSLAIGGNTTNTKQQGIENGRGEPDGEWGEEIRMIPEEYSEEESCERTEYRTVTEERLVPQVKAIYAFEGQGMTMTKGEVNKLDMMTHWRCNIVSLIALTFTFLLFTFLCTRCFSC